MDHKPLRYQQLANAYSYNTFCTTGRPIVLCVFLGAWAYTELDLNLIQQKIDHTLGKKCTKAKTDGTVDNSWTTRGTDVADRGKDVTDHGKDVTDRGQRYQKK